MPAQQPPRITMRPRIRTLPVGTELWRCHREYRPSTGFKAKPSHTHFGGSRFDGTDADPYPYLYAAAEPATALAEVLLRSLEFDGDTGMRRIPWAQARTYALTRLRTTAALEVILLVTEEDLAAVCQTSWLLETEHTGYVQTRYWASELRRQATRAQGLLWQSRRHRPREALVIFGDRGTEEVLEEVPDARIDLGTAEGTAEVNLMLAPLRAVIEHPGAPA